MAHSVLNDFGVLIPRCKARAALEAAGWMPPSKLSKARVWYPLISKRLGWDTSTPYTLRQAWEKHTGVKQ
jgi:hypothetical protein